MPLSTEQVDVLRVTGTSSFETALTQAVDETYKLFTMQESYGSEGYVPMMLSGIGAGQEWVDKRILHEVTEYGIKYEGKVYANGVKRKNTAVADSLVATASRVGAELAKDARQDSALRALNVLKANLKGFDNEPLFGTHTYSDAPDAPSYSNDIAGTNEPWYLLNEYSLIEATRTDENTTFAVNGGTADSYLGFHEDSVAMGWRHRKLFAPAFWANSVRSRAALTSANLRAAMNLQTKFKNDAGKRMGAKAKYLVVGTSNAAAAEALIKAALIDGGNTNLDLGRLQLVVLDDLED